MSDAEHENGNRKEEKQNDECDYKANYHTHSVAFVVPNAANIGLKGNCHDDADNKQEESDYRERDARSPRHTARARVSVFVGEFHDSGDRGVSTAASHGHRQKRHD